MRKKTLHFTFEVSEGEAAIEVTDPETGERVAREEAYSLHDALKSIGDPPKPLVRRDPDRWCWGGYMNKIIWFGEDIGDYVAILTHKDDGAEASYWVDWKLVEVYGIDDEDKRLFRLDDGIGSNPTLDIELAESDAHGFCKWDGCAELKVDVHVCSPRDLGKLLDAVKRVYVECALITGRDALDMCKEESWTPSSK